MKKVMLLKHEYMIPIGTKYISSFFPFFMGVQWNTSKQKRWNSQDIYLILTVIFQKAFNAVEWGSSGYVTIYNLNIFNKCLYIYIHVIIYVIIYVIMQTRKDQRTLCATCSLELIGYNGDISWDTQPASQSTWGCSWSIVRWPSLRKNADLTLLVYFEATFLGTYRIRIAHWHIGHWMGNHRIFHP